jgi:hypothetical protein
MIANGQASMKKSMPARLAAGRFTMARCAG